jgi:two-component system, chemotaxis family, sensor kinase CheA
MKAAPEVNPWESLLDQASTHVVLSEWEEFGQVAAQLCRLNEVAARPEAAEIAAGLVRPQTEERQGDISASLDRLRQILKNPAPAVSAPQQSSALNQDPELVGEFIQEAREHLQNVEAGLLGLEKEPATSEILNSIFRSFHTIKGLAGFLEFAGIQAVSHEVETILDLARTGKLRMTSALIDLTLESADFVSREIDSIDRQLKGEKVTGLEYGGLVERLRRAAAGDVSVIESPASEVEPEKAARPMEPVARMESIVESEAAPEAVNTASSKGKKLAAQDTMAIRVETAKLDYLLDMVGEMVIAESMVRLDPVLAGTQNTRLQRSLNQLRRVTEEVQKVAMATRMVPVGTLFQRVNRLVRDTAKKAGKLAEVELVGEDTQLDKTIIEELTDPIMHMVRNSIDHGIEPAAERTQAGKKAAGKIQLKAYRQADHIQIEIVDDGRGLNVDRILKKARERGLVAEGAQLADAEIFQLIFEPGFSTAEKVTDISGRGVGMDVVKRQIQKLRGKIEIQSKPGVGTTFYLKLPLTLAIIEGLVVGVGKERFILPIFSVQEMFRPVEGQVSTVQGRGEMVMVRNQLLPVVRLYRSLGVKPRCESMAEGLMIVAETEGRKFALMVDGFLGKQEVVIKNLGGALKNTPGIAGGAILGDGRVGLILDLQAIYNERAEPYQASQKALWKESILLAS